MAMTLEEALATLRATSEGLHSEANACSTNYRDAMKRRAVQFDNAIAALDAHLTQPAQAVDVGAARLQERANEIEDAICRGKMDVYQVFTQMRQLLPRALAGEKAEGWRDTERLDWIACEYWRLDPFDMPTGAGDKDVGWNVVEYFGDGTQRVVATCYADNPRRAIDDAIALASQPLPTPPTDGEE